MSVSFANPALQDTDTHPPMEDLSVPAFLATATNMLTSATLRLEDASVSTIREVITASFVPEDITETPSEVRLSLQSLSTYQPDLLPHGLEKHDFVL